MISYHEILPSIVRHDIEKQTSNSMNIIDRSTTSSNGDVRKLRLCRIENFSGFGFHVDHDRMFYHVYRIETNSPAEHAGLRIDDIILTIDDQSTDNMSHASFFQLFNTSNEIDLCVRNREYVIRTNQHVSNNQLVRSTGHVDIPTSGHNRISHGKYRTMLSRAMNKLTLRRE
jgi:predicted metalloprotease with PDZ domain